LINAIGPQTFAACITDVVWGAPSIIPPKEFIPQLRRMLRENAILWIDDEVVCGFGRLGKWFGYQLYDDITPDIMTIGKGISSSHLPAAGVVISKGISDFFDKFRWHHYSTFAAHPVCMAAVVANLKVMIKEKIPERASKIGKYLGEKLRQLEDGHKCVGLVNGIGLFWILEIVKNKETKEPFEKEDRDARYIGDISTKWPNLIVKQKGLEKGVILGGFAPNTLKIAPALTVTEEDVDKGVEALDYALSYIDKMCE
jgi:taurine--2-oxoglutarate transaminase